MTRKTITLTSREEAVVVAVVEAGHFLTKAEAIRSAIRDLGKKYRVEATA